MSLRALNAPYLLGSDEQVAGWSPTTTWPGT